MRIFLLISITLLTIACGSPKAENTNSAKQKTEQADNTKSSTNTNEDIEGNVDIRFKINGLEKDNTVKLIGQYIDKKYLADSSVVKSGGKFDFKRDKLFKKGFYYIVLPENKVIKLLIDNDQEFSFEADFDNIEGTAKIDGSLTNKLFYEDFGFKKGIDHLYAPIARKVAQLPPSSPEFEETHKEFLRLSKIYSDKNDELVKNYPDNFFVKFKIAGKNPLMIFPKDKDGNLDGQKQVEDFRIHFWDDFDFNEPGLINTPAFTNKLKRFFGELVPQNQDKIIKYTDFLMDKAAGGSDEYYKVITNWIALKYEPGKTKLMDGEAVYSHILLKYFTKEKATWLDEQSINTLRKRASEMVQSCLNKPMGDVTAKSVDGKYHTLSDIKKPVIIVYIYNTDCSHCAEETPKLLQFYSKWKNKGVEIFSIAANTTEEEWRKFNKKYNIPWIDIFDETNASWYPKYFVDVTPEIYVIDKNRKIFAKNLKVSQLETIMARINK